jgi:hypothetical protein
MLKFLINSAFLLASVNFCFSQKSPSIIKFSKETLNHPLKNKEVLENAFKYREIGTFKRDTVIENSIILENSYAKYTISNKSVWTKNTPNRKVKAIDIVFTKYPFKKEDWLTNYHELLSNRLKELFRIDSTLNNSGIEWNIVLQTSCKTDAETRKLFHGIVIHYTVLNVPVLTNENEDEHEAKLMNYIRSEKKKKEELKNMERDDSKMRVYNYNDPKQKKERKKKSKTCPSFR